MGFSLFGFFLDFFGRDLFVELEFVCIILCVVFSILWYVVEWISFSRVVWLLNKDCVFSGSIVFY